ncbi:MAG TPA: CDP-glycerol glycerophosphotransferase family protein [Vicinamibacterales bacterium]|jgi:hypothetical protein|nr:CDP-glycerol glycerophosphotransferase family protein [Vicinamibacterales bacterium]
MSANLVHDTWYRRMRSAAATAAHALDDSVSRLVRRKRRVLFEAASPVSVEVFRPVYERLRHDPRLEFNFTSCDRHWNAQSIFANSGFEGRVATPSDVQWQKFDLYINADFWNVTWLPRRPKRVHLFHGVAGKYELDAPVQIAPVVASFDRLLFPNADRLNRYVEAGIVAKDSPQAVLAGYPKVDRLVDGSLDGATIRRSLGLRSDQPTVLYAPTWSPYSSLNHMGEAVIEALIASGTNVLVKLHDRSIDGTKRGSGGIDWRTRLQRFSESGAIHLAERADVSPYLAAADALVTDHSSVGFEYMLLDRPIVVLDCPQLIAHANVNPQKVRLLRSAARVVHGAAELPGAIVDELSAPARRSPERRAIADDLFYMPGGAAARAAHAVYDLLGMPEPVLVSEPVPGMSALTTRPARNS